MRYKLLVLLTVFSFGLLVSCGEEAGVTPELLHSNHQTLQKAAISTSPVHTFSGDLVGSSKLVRNKNGISMSLKTTGLEPGSAVTVWWVVFNKPDECATSPCDVPDLFDPDVMTDVLYAAGHVIGGNGKGNFAASLSEGDNSGSIFPQPSPGLIDAETAEVHLVVRTHGQALPGLVNEQINSFNGGCPPNACVDIQGSIHQP